MAPGRNRLGGGALDKWWLPAFWVLCILIAVAHDNIGSPWREYGPIACLAIFLVNGFIGGLLRRPLRTMAYAVLGFVASVIATVAHGSLPFGMLQTAVVNSIMFVIPLTVAGFLLGAYRKRPGWCRNCGYDVSGDMPKVCPECGSRRG